MMRGIALCCAAVGLAGCSLLLSTSDLAEQAAPDGGGSAATEAGDAPVSSSDAATSDAATDAPVSSPDGSTRFCPSLSPAPKFCADFDGTGPVQEGWETLLIDPSTVGTVTRDSLGRDRSSLLAKLSAPVSCSYARPARTFPTSGFGMRVSYSFRPSSPWTTDGIFSLLNAEGTTADCGILFHFDGTSANLHFQYGSPEVDEIYEWAGAPTLDAWSKIETSIDLSGNITITVDDKKVISRSLPAACKAGNEVYFAPGFHCEGDAHEARYDDVVVDYP